MSKSDGRAVVKLTRHDLITLSLLRIAAEVVILKRELKINDYKRLTGLRPFVEAVDNLVSELGYDDEEEALKQPDPRPQRGQDQ